MYVPALQLIHKMPKITGHVRTPSGKQVFVPMPQKIHRYGKEEIFGA
jgi:hypothetical protein